MDTRHIVLGRPDRARRSSYAVAAYAHLDTNRQWRGAASDQLGYSLLKRGINGTYVSVEPFHLFRYLDEQAFRFNNRKMTAGERFSVAVSGIVGKRPTFNQLTGKTDEGQA
jgi:hypothetical protein